jgi:hypothetical protein
MRPANIACAAATPPASTSASTQAPTSHHAPAARQTHGAVCPSGAPARYTTTSQHVSTSQHCVNAIGLSVAREPQQQQQQQTLFPAYWASQHSISKTLSAPTQASAAP